MRDATAISQPPRPAASQLVGVDCNRLFLVCPGFATGARRWKHKAAPSAASRGVARATRNARRPGRYQLRALRGEEALDARRRAARPGGAWSDAKRAPRT